jgi:hypothetical protein
MRNPPADDVIPVPTFAPKVEAPCPEVEIPVVKKHKKKETCCESTCEVISVGCGHTVHVHHSHSSSDHSSQAPILDTSGGDGLGAVVKAAAGVMADRLAPESIESLSKRAMDNMKANGVSPETREMASKALDNLNSSDM